MFSYSHKKPSISTGQSLLKKRLAEAEIIGMDGKEQPILEYTQVPFKGFGWSAYLVETLIFSQIFLVITLSTC